MRWCARPRTGWPAAWPSSASRESARAPCSSAGHSRGVIHRAGLARAPAPPVRGVGIVAERPAALGDHGRIIRPAGPRHGRDPPARPGGGGAPSRRGRGRPPVVRRGLALGSAVRRATTRRGKSGAPARQPRRARVRRLRDRDAAPHRHGRAGVPRAARRSWARGGPDSGRRPPLAHRRQPAGAAGGRPRSDAGAAAGSDSPAVLGRPPGANPARVHHPGRGHSFSGGRAAAPGLPGWRRIRGAVRLCGTTGP